MQQSRSSSSVISIEQLHRRLYGSVPRKQGTAYERLAAVVFAQLGWLDVEHDQFEVTAGGTAEHQLDFVCRHPDGSVERLYAQCKYWKQKVGQPEMSLEFGVREQLKWDGAVVITQVGFTRGARQVATDQNMAMVILRPYNPAEDEGRWVTGVNTTITWPFTTFSDIVLHPEDPADGDELSQPRIQPWMNLWERESVAAETFEELWKRGNHVEQPDGAMRGSLTLRARRLVLGLHRQLIPIVGMEWTVRVIPTEICVSGTAQGAPVFWLEQIGEDGQVTHGSVITEGQLKLWDYDGKRVIRNDHPDESIHWKH